MRIHADLFKEPATKQSFKKQYLSLEMNASKGGLSVSATAYMWSVLSCCQEKPKLNFQLE